MTASAAAAAGISAIDSGKLDVDLPLGAQAGEARIREVVTEAGFARFRRAVDAPFNIASEVRP